MKIDFYSLIRHEKKRDEQAHRIIHSFLQQTFSEHLLCAGRFSRAGDRAAKQTHEVCCSHGACIPKEGQTLNKYTKKEKVEKKCCGTSERGAGVARGTMRCDPFSELLCGYDIQGGRRRFDK